jgi:hypothetical protein
MGGSRGASSGAVGPSPCSYDAGPHSMDQNDWLCFGGPVGGACSAPARLGGIGRVASYVEPPHDATVTGLEFKFKVGAGAPAGPVHCYLYHADAAGRPGARLAAFSDIDAGGFTARWRPYRSTGTAALEAGKRYWVVLGYAEDAGNYVHLAADRNYNVHKTTELYAHASFGAAPADLTGTAFTRPYVNANSWGKKSMDLYFKVRGTCATTPVPFDVPHWFAPGFTDTFRLLFDYSIEVSKLAVAANNWDDGYQLGLDMGGVDSQGRVGASIEPAQAMVLASVEFLMKAPGPTSGIVGVYLYSSFTAGDNADAGWF